MRYAIANRHSSVVLPTCPSSDAQIVCRFLLCLPIDGSADKQIIIYDSAYAPFIQDPDKPKTIFECEGAKQCAIESSSLSKLGE